MKHLGMLVFASLLGLISGSVKALVATDVWAWFVVPLGLPQIGYFHAWGLCVASALLWKLPHVPDDYDASVENAVRLTFSSVLFSLLVWGWSAVFAGLMP